MAESGEGVPGVGTRLEGLERENRMLRDRVYDLERSSRRTRLVLWGIVVVAVGHLVASQFFVLPWRQVAHFDRVTANRFEVPNQISSEYEFYHNTHDRPDAVFGWVSPDELEHGQWGGRDHERAQIRRGDGPGLYIRTPQPQNEQQREELKLGVLPGRVSVPGFNRNPR